MNCARVNETVISKARTFTESVYSVVDLHGLQHPFEIPVSQLLRIERNRGLRREQEKAAPSAVCHFHNVYDGRRRLPGSCVHGAGSRHSTPIIPSVPLIHPQSRLFSSQAETNGPQPLRRPPLPPRRPPNLAPSRLAAAIQIDDVLSKIPAMTGVEHMQQSINELEKYRKKQSQENRIDAPWFRSAGAIDTRFKEIQTALELAASQLKTIKIDARNKLDTASNISRDRVHRLQDRIRGAVQRIDHVAGLVQYERRMREVSDRHLKTTGLGPFSQRVLCAENQVDTLRRNLAELKYTIDWRAWHAEKIYFQLESVIEDNIQLKANGGAHDHTNLLLDRISDVTLKLNGRLDQIQETLHLTSHLMTQDQAQQYLRITAIAQDIAHFATTVPPHGHEFRKANRYALVTSRFPSTLDHTLLELQARPILSALSDGRSMISLLIDRAELFANVSKKNHFGYEKAQALCRSYAASTRNIRDAYLNFLQEGTLLLNPGLNSDLGRLKYALLRPFKKYESAILETTSSCRLSIDSAKRTYQEMSGMSDESRATRQRFLQGLVQMERRIRELVRPLVRSHNDFCFATLARLLDEDKIDPCLEQLVSKAAGEAKAQLDETKSLVDMSRPEYYRGLSATDILADPMRLRGLDTLYPAQRTYPVESVASERRIIEELKQVLLSKVVGVAMWGPRDITYPTHISLATTEKVVLIDWRWATIDKKAAGIRQALLMRLMQDADILKIVHNSQSVQQRIESHIPSPASLVGVTGTPWQPSNQLLNGRWTPIKLLTDMAFSSAYTLWTFLNASSPAQVSSASSRFSAGILQARGRLQDKIGMSHDSNIELGPVAWDHEGFFRSLSNSLNEPRNIRELSRVAQIAARSKLIRGAGRLAEPKMDDEEPLTAYYLFTTFAQDLSAIGKMMNNENIGRDILQAVEKFNLVLHAEDSERLAATSEELPDEVEGIKPIRRVPVSEFDILKSDPDDVVDVPKPRTRKERKRAAKEERRKAIAIGKLGAGTTGMPSWPMKWGYHLVLPEKATAEDRNLPSREENAIRDLVANTISFQPFKTKDTASESESFATSLWSMVKSVAIGPSQSEEKPSKTSGVPRRHARRRPAEAALRHASTTQPVEPERKLSKTSEAAGKRARERETEALSMATSTTRPAKARKILSRTKVKTGTTRPRLSKAKVTPVVSPEAPATQGLKPGTQATQDPAGKTTGNTKPGWASIKSAESAIGSQASVKIDSKAVPAPRSVQNEAQTNTATIRRLYGKY